MPAIPTIFDWLIRFERFQGEPAALLVLATAVLVVALWEWRLAVLGLAAQYLAAGLLFAQLLDPRQAAIKVVVGLFICLILYFTARQVNWGRLPEDVRPEEAPWLRPGRRLGRGRLSVSIAFLLRLGLALMLSTLVQLIAPLAAYQLPGVADPALNLAILALGGLGILGLLVTTEPLKAGLSLLMFFTGFELFFHGLSQSVALLAFLAAANLLLALVIAYLVQARYALATRLA